MGRPRKSERSELFSITERKDGRVQIYVPAGYLGMVAKVKTFADEGKARVFREEMLRQKRERDMPGVFLPGELTELAHLRGLLGTFGVTIPQACRETLVRLREARKVVTLGELKAAHLESIRKLNPSKGHVNSMAAVWRHLLETPAMTFGLDEGSPLSAVTTAAMEKLCWHCAASGTRTAFMSWRNKLACVFGFAQRMGWLSDRENPMRGVARFRKKKRPEVILAADFEKVARHYEAVPPDARDEYWLSDFLQWLLGGLAGLRPSEAARIQRRDFVSAEGACGVLHVENRKLYGESTDAEDGTTVEERAVIVRPNLRAWLDALPLPDFGYLCPHWAYKRRGKVLADLGVTLPKDGLRHSFATHHAAAFRDKAALMSDMGHNTLQITYEHYVRYVPPSEGEAWWKVRPMGR